MDTDGCPRLKRLTILAATPSLQEKLETGEFVSEAFVIVGNDSELDRQT